MKQETQLTTASIILATILVLLLLSQMHPLAIQNHNKKIDYSCVQDSDCIVRSTGCDCCGYISTCVNEDSVVGKCNLGKKDFTCECIHERPASCQCIQGRCETKETLELNSLITN